MSIVKHDVRAADLRSFGRKRGRKLSPRQQRLLSEVLPRVLVPDPVRLPPHSRESATVSDLEVQTPTWLEIGFGGGEHLLWQAVQNPNVTFIGCEPFEDGVVKVLTGIEDKKLANIRIHPDDARPLLRSLPANSISRAFILFPDPWPKKRHAKRRLVGVDTLNSLARAMKPGSELRIATDIGDYARTTLLAVRAVPAFLWRASSPADWRIQPPDWPETRYQAKALREGRRCYFFKFLRV
jgi:tRNA (guanine-N7-)-methyltransferase